MLLARGNKFCIEIKIPDLSGLLGACESSTINESAVPATDFKLEAV
jgi:hypothetical protein